MTHSTPPTSAPHTQARELGLIGGVMLGVGVYWVLGGSAGLSEEARRLAAVTALMAAWWISEAVPIAATALLPIVLFPVLGILPISGTTASYAHKLIFLFMGGLMLGAGLERWGAHKRLALLIILMVGTGPKRIIGGVMLSAAILSAFVSNIATAMMLLPIVLSIAALVSDEQGESKHSRRFSTCLILGLAYGCSIGGISTLTGTPPNALLAAYLSQEMGVEMSYARWLALGVPISAILLPISWAYLVFVALPVRIDKIPGGRQHIRLRLRDLGAMSHPEKRSILVFALTALAWITHGWIEQWLGIGKIDDASIAIGGAMVLFVLPAGRGQGRRLLTWSEAERIPWGVLILFGGGLAIARGMPHTGLDLWVGSQLASMGNPGELPLIGGVTTLVVFLTEITSNTATTGTMLPVIKALGEGVGVNPTILVIAAAVSASCAFMLPVATPPNAIVFASGRVSIRQMASVGLGLNLICIVLISLIIWAWAPGLLGLG